LGCRRNEIFGLRQVIKLSFKRYTFFGKKQNMKKVIFILIAFSLFSLLIAARAWSDKARGITVIDNLRHDSGKLGSYRALIIGIDDYKDKRIPDLNTATNDAKAIAKLLKKKYGFKIDLMLGHKATKRAMYNALRKLAASVKPGESVLIYYAGHGEFDYQYNDGWWIPVDAEAGNPLTYMENVQVQKAMRSMKARHVLLISDSCYSGTLFGQARSIPAVIKDKYYLNLYNEKSRWGMTSGNKTPVSDKGTEGHSIFAYQLLRALEKNNKPYISTQEIYTRIAPVIANNSEQTPLCRPIVNTGDQGGEFVFVASLRKDSTPTIPKVQMSSIDKDSLFWQSIQGSESSTLFEAYLERFPNGVFTAIAREKISTLKKQKIVASIPVDVTKSKLFVEVEPRDSKIRILNIKPKFRQGMELDPGRYHVEISANGYKTKKMWMDLEAGKNEILNFDLEQNLLSQVQASIQETPKYSISHKASSTSAETNRNEIQVTHTDEIVKHTKTGEFIKPIWPEIGNGRKYRWKMVTTWPPRLPLIQENCERFAELVAEKSNGRLKIDVYAAGELVPPMGVFDAVSDGAVEVGNAASYYWAGKEPAVSWFAAVPFGMNARGMRQWLHHEGGLQLWEEVYKPFNLIPRPAGSMGAQMGGWFNKKIHSMNDIKGLKIRMPGLGGRVLAKAGATVVLSPGGEIFTNLERGVIDAVEWVGPFHDMRMGFYQVAKYYYYPGWHEPGTYLEFLFNRKAYMSLPSALQKVLDQAALDCERWVTEQFDIRNRDALKTLVEKHNVRLERFPNSVLEGLERIAKSVIKEQSRKSTMAEKVYRSYQKTQEEMAGNNSYLAVSYLANYTK
jgi:TRAP-type mannitol/chloroaromatic compound transport system substrate-binding protein